MGITKYEAYMKCSECGGVAFYFERMPLRYDAITSYGVFKVDGAPVVSGTSVH